jgi:hypothetical protein
MFKKFPAILAILAVSLSFARSYAQQPSPSPAALATPGPTDYSAFPPATIIDKLQEKIILWQDDIINGMQAQIILPNLYREMAGTAVDTDNGKVKDQKLLDLLSKYGIGVSTKDGTKINTASTTPPLPSDAPETVPLVEIKDSATAAEKARIRALLEKCQTLVDRANGYKKLIGGLQSVILELLQLAKTDSGAQSIVDKYHIKQQSPIPVATP